MPRYLAIAAVLALAVALAAFLLGSAFPLLPSPVLAVILFLCPSHAFFAATAACAPFDACSLEMLFWVLAANVALYTSLAAVLWATRQRWRSARYAVLGIAASTSGWWVTQWV